MLDHVLAETSCKAIVAEWPFSRGVQVRRAKIWEEVNVQPPIQNVFAATDIDLWVLRGGQIGVPFEGCQQGFDSRVNVDSCELSVGHTGAPSAIV